MVPLFSLMGIGLRHQLCQPYLELVPQRHLLVVGDEFIEAVKHQVVNADGVLTPVDAAVLYLLIATEGHSVVLNEYLTLLDKQGAIRAPHLGAILLAATQQRAAHCSLLPAYHETISL